MSSIQQTPDHNSPESDTTTTEPATNETQQKSPSFAERVGNKLWVPAPDPFSIATDYQIGVRLFESRRDRQMAIMFGDGRPEDKPSQSVIDRLKEAGYRWNPTDRIWAHKFTPSTVVVTRLEAKRLHTEICEMIRQEYGIEPGPGISR